LFLILLLTLQKSTTAQRTTVADKSVRPTQNRS
jgi:hypothetical protein